MAASVGIRGLYELTFSALNVAMTDRFVPSQTWIKELVKAFNLEGTFSRLLTDRLIDQGIIVLYMYRAL